MKKILSIALLLVMTLSLSSCVGKQKFEDLPTTEQTKIQQEIQANIFEPYIQDVMATALQAADMSEEDMNLLMTQKGEKLKTDLINYLQENYPNIDFNVEELAAIDMTYPPAGMQEQDEVNTDDLNNIVNEVEDVDMVDVTVEQ